MTEREASKEQFGAWRQTVAVYGAPDAGSPAGKWMLTAWQASRKQALEEAAVVCDQQAGDHEFIFVNFQAADGCEDCARAIRSLSQPTGGKE